MKKTAIVTGAAGGIGFATVQKLLDNNYRILACINTASKAERFVPYGEDVVCVCADLGTSEGREKVMKTAEQFARIDVLVNVAGIAPKVRMDLLEMTEESYDRVMDVNTKSTMFLTQAVANRMVKQEPDEHGQRGYIVNISSLSAYATSVNRGEYCVSKAGVSMITKLFADRLAGESIPVNEVRPGIIATDMTAKVQEKYDNLIAGGLLPIPRWGKPEDIAEAVYVLCNGALKYTTGQSIDVDGGFHLKRL